MEKDRHWWRELGGEEAGLDEGRHEEEEELKDGEGGEDERGQGALEWGGVLWVSAKRRTSTSIWSQRLDNRSLSMYRSVTETCLGHR